jgi:hypothetical protein
LKTPRFAQLFSPHAVLNIRGEQMRVMKVFAIIAVAAGLSFFAASPAKAQVSIGINLGPAPVCPYGYYDYAPYNCAPYGYYGPEWFSGGVFLGAGPWFHGPHGFHGHVNNHYDPRHGYHGAYPPHGGHESYHAYGHNQFHGNETRGGYNNHGGDHGDNGHGGH